VEGRPARASAPLEDVPGPENRLLLLLRGLLLRALLLRGLLLGSHVRITSSSRSCCEPVWWTLSATCARSARRSRTAH